MTHALGRLLDHDPRSRNFAFQVTKPKPELDTFWVDNAPVLDQGDIGGCVGWTGADILNTESFAAVRKAKNAGRFFTDADGLRFYEAATKADNIPGYYLPGDPRSSDTGSSGLGLGKGLKKLGLITGYSHAFTWNSFVQAILTQPVALGTLWTQCVVPNTRVLTTDLEWIDVQKLNPGDRIIGFDEDVRSGCAYRQAEILTNDRIVQECVEIATDRGSITASTGHMFVQRHEKAARHWVRADQIKPGDQVMYMGRPWDTDNSYEAGWLAGFYDGEGCLSDTRDGGRSNFELTAAQNQGPTLDFCLKLLDAKGFDYGVKNYGTSDARQASHVYLRGPNAKCRFLGQIRPQRLLAVSHRAWEGLSITRNHRNYATVQDVRSAGRQEVMAIGTSTRTLVTDGFLSHNSMFKPDSRGVVHVGPLTDSNIVGGHEFSCRGVSFSRGLVLCRNHWTATWNPKTEGQKLPGEFWLSIPDLQALLAQQGDVTVLHGTGTP